ncbi:MAG: pyruvate:ferredoxin (flavodoxin) oxidoreductase [Chloroflexota bacterium]
MTEREYKTLDGNEAVARVAYKLNEVIAIYPITPSSPMGEWADDWSAAGKPNLWGTVPSVVEMQSEAGAAGAIHGALQTGALTTTFTASQGLLLMLPNFYKIAGEMTSAVFHIAARSLAAQGLSIFGDHSDVMAARGSGFAMLASASVQEAQDFALIAQAATLEARLPFLHFFDGFRTSHEVAKIELLPDDVLRAMIDDLYVYAHRERALSPDNPFIRGTAQNPDVYFQARETVNPHYAAVPGIVQRYMDRFAELTGRQYRLYEYYGAPDAERVIVLMGSSSEATRETIDVLTAQGEKVGAVTVRLYRPLDNLAFYQSLPATVKHIAVLDRTKEPGSGGEPLYLDVLNAVYEGCLSACDGPAEMPLVTGGRYGLSSKEFTPAMIKGIFDHQLEVRPKNHFTIGIVDDVCDTSLEYDEDFDIEPKSVTRALFYGLGSDGTVGANKNTIKIIGENTDNYAQGYFVYDSKKSGAMTVSHLRFGPKPIRSTYLINRANFVACHQPIFLERIDVLERIERGGTFLLNIAHPPDDVWRYLPESIQRTIIEKQLRFFVIDGYGVARAAGMGSRINTVMQTAFFAISGVLPQDEAIDQIKKYIRKTYGDKGDDVVAKNIEAVDAALDNLHEVTVPQTVVESPVHIMEPVAADAPPFVRNVLGEMIALRGDRLPVSKLPVDGTYPSGTTRYEKRNLAHEIPVWNSDICIQCGKCAMVCPHAAIRIKAYDEGELANAPETFKAVPSRDFPEMMYTIQVAPEDCTSCNLCVEVCPARNKAEPDLKALFMQPQPELRETEAENWDFFLQIPEMDRRQIKNSTIRQQQIQQPLFEFSGACSGCGETPYVKLLTQLFGDRTMVANATGCSSIFGGNLPTTPWSLNNEGRGPSWSNSLFEDNAEFGMGMRVALDKKVQMAEEMLLALRDEVGADLADDILKADQSDEAGIYEQRERVETLKLRLADMFTPAAEQLLTLADVLVKKSVWIVGGDGWAYDIGFGGLDHVLASGRDVNILVLDTEVYSNTGGQASKATPRAAVAKFAAGGKPARKKDLGMMAMTYGNVYVATVAMGAKDQQTLQAFIEAERHPGPSLIIAYSHCIAHGIDMSQGLFDQKSAVETGEWILYRYNPARTDEGKNPLQLDSRRPKAGVETYMNLENRFRILRKRDPEAARELALLAQEDIDARWTLYEYMANRPFEPVNGNGRD